MCRVTKLRKMSQLSVLLVFSLSILMPHQCSGFGEKYPSCSAEDTDQICQAQNQVCQRTQFFSVSFFCKKIIDLPGGQINDPASGKHCSLPFLPATHSSSSRPLLPELQIQGHHQEPSTRLVRCFRNYRDTRTPLGVPR